MLRVITVTGLAGGFFASAELVTARGPSSSPSVHPSVTTRRVVVLMASLRWTRRSFILDLGTRAVHGRATSGVAQLPDGGGCSPPATTSSLTVLIHDNQLGSGGGVHTGRSSSSTGPALSSPVRTPCLTTGFLDTDTGDGSRVASGLDPPQTVVVAARSTNRSAHRRLRGKQPKLAGNRKRIWSHLCTAASTAPSKSPNSSASAAQPSTAPLTANARRPTQGARRRHQVADHTRRRLSRIRHRSGTPAPRSPYLAWRIRSRFPYGNLPVPRPWSPPPCNPRPPGRTCSSRPSRRTAARTTGSQQRLAGVRSRPR